MWKFGSFNTAPVQCNEQSQSEPLHIYIQGSHQFGPDPIWSDPYQIANTKTLINQL